MCFLIGKHRLDWLLTPVSGEWWSEDYADAKGWVNMFCGISGDRDLHRLLHFMNAPVLAESSVTWTESDLQ